MPLDMLRRIAQQPLPLTLESPADVDRVRVLHASGLVAALFLKAPAAEEGDGAALARVLAVTPDGHAALAIQDAGHVRTERPDSV